MATPGPYPTLLGRICAQHCIHPSGLTYISVNPGCKSNIYKSRFQTGYKFVQRNRWVGVAVCQLGYLYGEEEGAWRTVGGAGGLEEEPFPGSAGLSTLLPALLPGLVRSWSRRMGALVANPAPSPHPPSKRGSWGRTSGPSGWKDCELGEVSPGLFVSLALSLGYHCHSEQSGQH